MTNITLGWIAWTVAAGAALLAVRQYRKALDQLREEVDALAPPAPVPAVTRGPMFEDLYGDGTSGWDRLRDSVRTLAQVKAAPASAANPKPGRPASSPAPRARPQSQAAKVAPAPRIAPAPETASLPTIAP